MSTETKPATKTAADSDRVLTGTHFMVGDHACAEGALAAGLDFFAGYPITPSTEVAERLAHRMPRVGAKFVQMEDELASMAAIIGASCAGGRTLTATSGPGFSLMMENIGLAAMTEVPCVVVNVMRAGPSTGLPTAVGQADILQARWGSHGDYGIVAYSPSSPQECFDLTIKAFNMADRYRIPAFVLMDETVGHMTERVVIPPEEEIVRVPRKAPKMARLHIRSQAGTAGAEILVIGVHIVSALREARSSLLGSQAPAMREALMRRLAGRGQP